MTSINLTQECIDKGDHHPLSCPVALACREAGIRGPRVNQNGTVWGTGPHGYGEGKLPADIRMMIAMYDLYPDKYPMQPRTFDLNIVAARRIKHRNFTRSLEA